MKNIIFLLLFLTFICGVANSQKYITKNGMIKFYSHSPLEDIEAVNNQVNSALEASKGDFVFKVLMKGFEFKKALMQEHFNENYVESDKFPDAIFKGKITNITDININKEGIYNADIEGDLTIHGITKKVNEKGTFEIKNNSIIGKSVFKLKINDYNIRIPNTVANNLSEVIEITVNVVLSKL